MANKKSIPTTNGLQPEQWRIKRALKTIMKEKKVEYRELADLWKCSLVTVKRVMSKEDLSLNRLLVLLDHLEFSFSDLEKKMAVAGESNYRLTKRQIDFLVKKPHFLAFLVRLYDDESPEEIARSVAMSKASLQKYLMGLENIDLIRVTSSGRVKPSFPEMFDLPDELGRIHIASILRATFRYFDTTMTAGKKPGSKGTLAVTTTDLSEATIVQFRQRYADLLADLKTTADLERKLYPKSKLKKFVIAALSHEPVAGEPALHLVERPFGEVLAEI